MHRAHDERVPRPVHTLPPAPRPFPAQGLARRHDHLLAELARPARHRRLPRTSVLVAAAASVLTAGGVAAAYAPWAETTEPDEARCYTVLTTDGGEDFPGSRVAYGARLPDGSRDTADALGSCTALWRAGLLRLGQTPGPAPDVLPTDYPVPQLTACVLGSGITAVYPGDEGVCSRLGLPRLQTTPAVDGS